MVLQLPEVHTTHASSKPPTAGTLEPLTDEAEHKTTLPFRHCRFDRSTLLSRSSSFFTCWHESLREKVAFYVLMLDGAIAERLLELVQKLFLCVLTPGVDGSVPTGTAGTSHPRFASFLPFIGNSIAMVCIMPPCCGGDRIAILAELVTYMGNSLQILCNSFLWGKCLWNYGLLQKNIIFILCEMNRYMQWQN